MPGVVSKRDAERQGQATTCVQVNVTHKPQCYRVAIDFDSAITKSVFASKSQENENIFLIVMIRETVRF